ncbi:MAG: TIM barrel protein [Bacteroidota bacterium]
MNTRRTFVKTALGALGGLGIGLGNTQAKHQPEKATPPSRKALPNNPLVLFDNFHSGNRANYSWKAKFAAAQAAGFDGFEMVMIDPTSDRWKEIHELAPTTNFSLWGYHWTTKAVVDRVAPDIQQEIEQIIRNVEACGKSPLSPYFTLSLSGRDELNSPTIAERGSAKAQDRHWERAYQIIAAFDKACREHGVKGSLYPHIDWICDTPQSAVKILDGANASTVAPAFCSHHWYANENSASLDETLAMPRMKDLQYVVMTNGHFRKDGFNAVRFDQGQIDMAWILAKLYAFGYEGPISSQGWRIFGDPFLSLQSFVSNMKALRRRFFEQPELNPLG